MRPVLARTASAVLALLLLAEPSAGQAVGYYPHLVSANAPDPDQVYRYMPEAEQWRVPALPMVGEKDHQLSRELVIRPSGSSNVGSSRGGRRNRA